MCDSDGCLVRSRPLCVFFFFFFFQAEDGIRDLTVTGVQTCALPISPRRWRAPKRLGPSSSHRWRRRSGDRKSTRLNSSHSQISYAVFCLKKKNNIHTLTLRTTLVQLNWILCTLLVCTAVTTDIAMTS